MKEFRLGLDVGSTTIKTAVLDEKNNVVYSSYRRHLSDIRLTLKQVLDETLKKFDNISIIVTGSGGIGVSKWLGINFVQEVLAGTRAIEHYLPETDVAIELGGEDAKIVYFKPTLEHRMNGICAGGTGAFIDQMATLLHTDAAGLDKLAEKHTAIYPIASRCGVFAKTDIQSFLNSGAKKSDIAASVFQAVVSQTIINLAQGKAIRGNVALLGGPMHFLPQLRERFIQNLKADKILVPENSQIFNAIGAALLSDNKTFSADVIKKRLAGLSKENEEVERLAPLFADDLEREEFFMRHDKETAGTSDIKKHTGPAFLGIDAGSTTTKVVLINANGDILHSYYSSNEGKPLETVIKGVCEIYSKLPKGAFIGRATVTGYGEHLVKMALGVDKGEVETIAHLTASEKFLPGVNFILDIGGQDMKAFRVQDSVISDVLLNEACSSGCGSFIQTYSDGIGMSVKEFAALGLEGKFPVDLGSRCTVFMNSSIKQAQRDGATINDISAGLAYSIVKNALFKVIRIKDFDDLGEKIVVQGGTFLNDSVLRAFEKLTGRTVVRPNIAGLMGAYGAALISQNEYTKGATSTILPLGKMKEFSVKKNTATCKRCSNNCLLTVSTFGDGRKFITNNRCEEGFGEQTQTKKSNIVNMYEEKYNRLFGYKSLDIDKAPRGQIGIPRVLNMYENYPFWHTFFTTLGYSVKLSPSSNHELYNLGINSIPSESVCFPAKLTHGHIESLINDGVKLIFFPCIPLEINEYKHTDNHFNCPVVATYPENIRMNMSESFGDSVKFMSPFLPYNSPKHMLSRLYEEFPNIPKSEIKKALDAGYTEDKKFKADIRVMGEKALAKMEKEGGHGIVLAGRPYHLDKEINHGIPQMISSYGLYVFTEDCVAHLDVKKEKVKVFDQWMYHSRLFLASKFIATRNDLDLLQLNSFGCGLDAVTIDTVKELLEGAGKIYTGIKIDEISNLGAARIRARSLLSVLEKRKSMGITIKEPTPSKPRILFTKQMKAERTILAPQMSPIHFNFIKSALVRFGFNVEILKDSPSTVEAGLRFVHNDACYPAIMTVGSVMDALLSGKYDLDKVVVVIQQTNGGCRSSNYITMLRLALQQAKLDHVPVLSLNLGGKAEKNPGFKATVPMMKRLSLAIIYGDLLSRLLLRVRPYEKEKGSADALYKKWDEIICQALVDKNVNLEQNAKKMIEEFGAIPTHDIKKPRIAIVGEILVKYHPLSNNYLIDLLENEDCEVVVPDMTDFFMYGFYRDVVSHKLLAGSYAKKLGADFLIWYLTGLRKNVVKALKGTKFGYPNHTIYDFAKMSEEVISPGNACGEGWFLAAEMMELLESEIDGIVCVQPFGCMPNHVVGKGVIKPLKEKYPNANIIAIDYDPGASQVNQANRIKLMLATAFKKIDND